ALISQWRAPLLLTASSLPSHAALEAQAEALARFAAISQQAGLVPIVEPDVDFGGDASLARSVEIHARALALIYARCAAYGVLLEGTLLKPSFPQPGTGHPARATTAPADVAQATLAVLARAVPAGVAGVVFLSGGLPDATAAAYLQAANALLSASQDGKPEGKREYARVPPLTFSFGRGLQGDAMVKWAAGDEAGARAVFRARAEELSRAAKGEPL
ncbi:fructose-bisphosphate aldolase, partial [Phellopilus nigrolimitatus]